MLSRLTVIATTARLSGRLTLSTVPAWSLRGRADGDFIDGVVDVERPGARFRHRWRARRRGFEPVGTWRWQQPDDPGGSTMRLRLERRDGTVWALVPGKGGETVLNDFYLHGASVRFRLQESFDEEGPWTYTGNIEGDRIVGTRRPVGGEPIAWSAVRGG